MTDTESRIGLQVDAADALAAAGDALAVEGTIAPRAGSAGSTCVWLFQAECPPRQISLEDVPHLITVEENLIWIDLAEYCEDHFRRVAALTEVDEPVVASVLNQWERPHMQRSGDSFAASVTVPESAPGSRQVLARQLNLVVGRNYLMSVHASTLPFYDDLLARASMDPDLVRLDSGFMLYIVLDELLTYYEALEEQVRGDIESMQVVALRANSEAFLEDLLQFKRYAFALTQLTQQHESLYGAFLRPDFPFLSAPEIVSHFRDLERRLHRLIDRLEQVRQEANNAFDIYLSHQSHRTNGVMKILTMVATILFTATFIEGIFSPSFGSLPTHTEGGLAVMLLLVAVATALELYAFHRRGWM